MASPPESGLDTYQGSSWTDRAALGSLRAGLDPEDTSNRRNRHIDLVQRRALRWALGQVTAKEGRIARLLDFGCGAGRMLQEFSPFADEVWGCDRNDAMIEVARATHSLPDSRLFLWDAHSYRAVPKFDAIVTTYVTL